jgi:hypothetical protein
VSLISDSTRVPLCLVTTAAVPNLAAILSALGRLPSH